MDLPLAVQGKGNLLLRTTICAHQTNHVNEEKTPCMSQA